MAGSCVRIGAAPVAPVGPAGQAADEPAAASVRDAPDHRSGDGDGDGDPLVAPAFIASLLVAAAPLPRAVGAWSAFGAASVAERAALLLLAVALAAMLAHVLDLQRHGVSAARRRRHRWLLLMLGGACAAWAGAASDVAGPGGQAMIVGMLVLLCGLGGCAAAGDRSSLAAWLGTVCVAPAIWLGLGPVAGERPPTWPLLLSGLAVVAAHGRIVGLIGRTTHIRVENERLVARLRQQVQLVEAGTAEKSRFLGAASHDLRQPMHAIGLFAAALERELRGTPQHARIISMTRAIDALEESFGTMLDISKLDAGIVQPSLQAFPIRDTFRRLHMHCAGLAEERGLSLRFKPGGKLVTSDPQLLERILSNLVLNAIRYTQAGGVVVVTRTRAGCTSLEVWDTGPGIPADELPRIFDEFYQVDNPGRERARGLGMGLSIVKRLVLLLGHELEVRSAPGRGTVFRVLLRTTELSDMGSMVLGADTVPAQPDEDRTVLVIDDEAPVREGMRVLLEGWGFSVLLAADAADACRCVHAHAGVIHVVVSDFRLGTPGDGLEAIDAVRREYGAPLPAILVTGDTAAAEVRRLHAGGHPVLFKPVRARDLFAALRSIP